MSDKTDYLLPEGSKSSIGKWNWNVYGAKSGSAIHITESNRRIMLLIKSIGQGGVQQAECSAAVLIVRLNATKIAVR